MPTNRATVARNPDLLPQILLRVWNFGRSLNFTLLITGPIIQDDFRTHLRTVRGCGAWRRPSRGSVCPRRFSRAGGSARTFLLSRKRRRSRGRNFRFESGTIRTRAQPLVPRAENRRYRAMAQTEDRSRRGTRLQEPVHPRR